MAAPTLISYTEVSWTTAATTKTTASISWQIGDVLVVISGDEGAASAPSIPSNTGTGLSWANQKVNAVTGCHYRIDTAVASAASSGTVTVTEASSQKYGFAVWVYRGSAGVGNSAATNGASTTSLTPTGADGAIVWAVFNFNADALTAITPTPTTTRQLAQSSPNYSFGVANLNDQTSAGAVSYGVTGGTAGANYCVACEIKSSGAAATPNYNFLNFFKL